MKWHEQVLPTDLIFMYKTYHLMGPFLHISFVYDRYVSCCCCCCCFVNRSLWPYCVVLLYNLMLMRIGRSWSLNYFFFAKRRLLAISNDLIGFGLQVFARQFSQIRLHDMHWINFTSELFALNITGSFSMIDPIYFVDSP